MSANTGIVNTRSERPPPRDLQNNQAVVEQHLKDNHDNGHIRVDHLERLMLSFGDLVHQPLHHTFLPGMYVRAIFNPRGSLVTTKVHLTRHPYFVMRGRALVYTYGSPVHEVVAPCWGVTEPGTRRVIAVYEDVTWVTVHSTLPEEDREPDIGKRLQMIEHRIIERRELVPGKSSNELYLEMLNRARLGRDLAVDLNPGMPIPEMDNDDIESICRLIAGGGNVDVPTSVVEEAAGHMEELGINVFEEA